jgi:phosphonate transport system ATP-binding protein
VDEPTSSLDPKIGAEVMDLMSTISKEDGIPMLVSVHDVQLAKKYSDRIVGLQNGVKIFDDRTATVDSESLGKIYDMAS